MRWEDFRTSSNVEDRRGMGLPGGAGGLGIGTIVILGLIGWALGIDPRILIGGAEMMTAAARGTSSSSRAAKVRRRTRWAASPPRFSATRKTCGRRFCRSRSTRQYKPPKLVLFSDATRSGCGGAQSAMGPFYCPLDQTVYIDLSFFQEMQRRFRAGGDFAYAYVLAHEVGHHVENQLGILPRVQERQREVGQAEGNQLSVRVELMADCLAGVWAHHSDQRWKSLEPGDIEEAIRRGGGHRRRPPAEAEPGPRRARFLHPRLLGAARALAHDRLEERARSKPATRSGQAGFKLDRNVMPGLPGRPGR